MEEELVVELPQENMTDYALFLVNNIESTYLQIEFEDELESLPQFNYCQDSALLCVRHLLLDHLVLYHALEERSIVLHILVNGEMQAGKKGRFYGFDAQHLYTKKEMRHPNGESDLHHHVKLSKKILGHCAPLALETNGSIFSGNRLDSNRRAGAIKRFANTFAERVVLTAQPNPCQVCECIANNDGLTQMECTPCNYPMPVAIGSIRVSI
ncbi:hypothetical protein QAD02_007107 [Eretmocerus hayati]|uniref:Uncharacterized protein n=1 Tax=Eretmocerus hayati TaxID=131215 RepID=A0ACC2N728_9HYME|nr:hypothetical protein QAD02_007107 [Eretmocerus hayati]